MHIEYDGEPMIITGDSVHCPGKKAWASLEQIKRFVFEDRAIQRKKRVVGTNEDNKPLIMWDDGTYVHIGCLKETSESFQQKFFQVLNP